MAAQLEQKHSNTSSVKMCLFVLFFFLTKARIMTGPLLTSDLPLCGLLQQLRTHC